MVNIRIREKTSSWPGFVDLFSNLVIILIFLLIVFVFLWTTTSVFNKTSGAKTVAELKKTTQEQAETIAQMTADEQEAKRLLLLARAELENLENDKVELSNEVNALDTELQEIDLSIEDLIAAYESKVSELQAAGVDMQKKLNEMTTQLNQMTVDKEKTAQLEQERRELQQQMDAQRVNLSDQLASLQAALDAAEAKAADQEVQYVEMSTRLNKALADKVAELKNVAQYQSDFYKSIKTALGDRSTIQPDGDRFIVSSDILFPSGSYTLSPEGKKQLRLIANVIRDLESKIPSDVNWIIRVDGHTDRKPIIPGTKGYRNNTELSLRRATAVADELARNGVSKRRLVPSGFGEMHPVELGNDAASMQKNRRIELQLTNR